MVKDEEMRITVSRDRDGSFESLIVPKHARRWDGFDDKIIALYARGMSVRDIQSELLEIYDVEVSPELISTVTDEVMSDVAEWINRPKELLGMYMAENEGAKFWLNVMTELKNRGVQDVFIASVDGLKGFPEAIKSLFPQTQVQLCIVHQIGNSMKFVSLKDRKSVAADLKKTIVP